MRRVNFRIETGLLQEFFKIFRAPEQALRYYEWHV